MAVVVKSDGKSTNEKTIYSEFKYVISVLPYELDVLTYLQPFYVEVSESKKGIFTDNIYYSRVLPDTCVVESIYAPLTMGKEVPDNLMARYNDRFEIIRKNYVEGVVLGKLRFLKMLHELFYEFELECRWVWENEKR